MERNKNSSFVVRIMKKVPKNALKILDFII